MRILGIDYGAKKTGLAIADNETKIASPLFVVTGGMEGVDQIKTVINEEGIEKIVIGLPTITAEGQVSNHREATLAFIEFFKKTINLPVNTVDEQFTSKESERLRAEGAEAEEDALAAMLILQDYLN